MKLFENFKLPDVETLKNTVEAIKDNLTPAEKAKESSKDKSKETAKEEVPAGCIKCPSCGNILEKKALGRLKICPKCAKLFRLNSKDRVKTIADENSFVEFDINMEAKDPLNFPDYKTKIKSVQEKTGLKDAIRTGKCTIGGYETVLAVMDSTFLMGSMGSVVGEKITRAVEKSTELGLPIVILFSLVLVVLECRRVLFLLCRWLRLVLLVQNIQKLVYFILQLLLTQQQVV